MTHSAVASPLATIGDSLANIGLTGHSPVADWRPQHHGQIDIRIKADGSWWHEGTLIQREPLVKLFASVLWYENGQHYLKTPVEQLLIQVDDAPFYMNSLAVVDAGTANQQLVFTSHYGDVVLAGADHPLWLEEDAAGNPLPYIGMRYGMKGKLSRPVFYQLADYLEVPLEADSPAAVEAEVYWVRSKGVVFPLGSSDC